jgi:restriction endonuclease Mrr
VWVRRWKKTRIGEIPLRNFAQAVNDLRVKKGLLVTTAELTESAKTVAERLNKIVIVPPEELNTYLKGLL